MPMNEEVLALMWGHDVHPVMIDSPMFARNFRSDSYQHAS
jgi:hypothetical protein